MSAEADGGCTSSTLFSRATSLLDVNEAVTMVAVNCFRTFARYVTPWRGPFNYLLQKIVSEAGFGRGGGRLRLLKWSPGDWRRWDRA